MRRKLLLMLPLLILASVVVVSAKSGESRRERNEREMMEAEAKAQQEREAEEALLIKVVDPNELYEGSSELLKKNREVRRVERNINQKKYIFKGEIIGGITASYTTLDTSNASYFLLLENLTVNGSVASVKPFLGYFYRDNRAVGARFGYVTYQGQIDSGSLDMGVTNDINFDIPYVKLESHNFSYSLFHRSYAALDDKGNFGVFAEIEAAYSQGGTKYEFESGDDLKFCDSRSQSFDLSFNPGVSAFLFHNVSATLSFEFGGLNYTKIRQYDIDGNYFGSRDSSKMKFKFNVLAINFGLTAHIW